MEVNTHFKPGERVYLDNGSSRKVYATVVTWEDFVKRYNYLYGTLYGRSQAERAVANYPLGSLTLIQYDHSKDATFALAASLKCHKPKLPEYLW